jgi:hypothetical protein
LVCVCGFYDQVAQPGQFYSLELKPNDDGQLPVIQTLSDVLRESLAKRRRLHTGCAAAVVSDLRTRTVDFCTVDLVFDIAPISPGPLKGVCDIGVVAETKPCDSVQCSPSRRARHHGVPPSAWRSGVGMWALAAGAIPQTLTGSRSFHIMWTS